jgi:hypothetical protein
VCERQVGRYIRDAARLASLSRAERLALTLDRDDLAAATGAIARRRPL